MNIGKNISKLFILIATFCALTEQSAFAKTDFSCPSDRWKVVFYDHFAIWDDDTIKAQINSDLAYGYSCFRNDGPVDFLEYTSATKVSIKPIGNPYAFAEDNYTAIFTKSINIPEDWEYIFSFPEIDDGVELIIDGVSYIKIYEPISNIQKKIYLKKGLHTITIKYLERGFVAQLIFNFQKNSSFVPSKDPASGECFEDIPYGSRNLCWPADAIGSRSFSFNSGGGWNPCPQTGIAHVGQDIVVTAGTNILSVASGRVVHVGGAWNGGFGNNVVVISHGNNVHSIYAHASRSLVENGSCVRKGQAIALVGGQGYTCKSINGSIQCGTHINFPHIHFEMTRLGGNLNPGGGLPEYQGPWCAGAFDPMPYFPDRLNDKC